MVPDDAAGAGQSAAESRATLLALDGEGTEYWLGFDNFYANCPVCSPTRAALRSAVTSSWTACSRRSRSGSRSGS